MAEFQGQMSEKQVQAVVQQAQHALQQAQAMQQAQMVSRQGQAMQQAQMAAQQAQAAIQQGQIAVEQAQFEVQKAQAAIKLKIETAEHAAGNAMGKIDEILGTNEVSAKFLEQLEKGIKECVLGSEEQGQHRIQEALQGAKLSDEIIEQINAVIKEAIVHAEEHAKHTAEQEAHAADHAVHVTQHAVEAAVHAAHLADQQAHVNQAAVHQAHQSTIQAVQVAVNASYQQAIEQKIKVKPPKVKVAPPTVVVAPPKIAIHPPHVEIAIPKIDVKMPEIEIAIPELDIDKMMGEDKVKFERTIQLNGAMKAGSELVVENHIGEINIKPGKVEQCVVNAVITGYGDTEEEAQQNAEKAKAKLENNKGTVQVSVQKPDEDDKAKFKVDFEITVPQKSNIAVASMVSEVVIEGIEGKIGCALNVGNLEVTDTVGDIGCAISAGSFNAKGIAGNIDIDIEAGSVLAGYAEGAPAACNINIVVSAGTIELVLPEEISAEASVVSTMGSIKTDLPLAITKLGGGMVQLSEKAEGILGSGEGQIDIKMNVGSVTIRTGEIEEEVKVKVENVIRQ
ncbi:MAG: DUF4097 domain-containing protein [Planctomycetes bacterium]|nr:DUF4097 domain-containing protein [Planctomycetota bacterium]